MSVLVPHTGEVVDLSEVDDVSLAAVMDSIAEIEADLRSAKRELSDEIAKRLDYLGRRSVDAGEFRLEVTPPQEKEWDLDRLRSDLAELVEEGVISQQKATACVKWTPSPVWAQIKTLLSDPRCSRLEHAFKLVPATRYVKVRRG